MIEIITKNAIFERQVRQLLASSKLKDAIRNEPIRTSEEIDKAVGDTAIIYITDNVSPSLENAYIFCITDSPKRRKDNQNIYYYKFSNFDTEKFINDLFFIVAQKDKAIKKISSVKVKDNYIKKLETYLTDERATLSEARDEQKQIMMKDIDIDYDTYTFYQPYCEMSGDFIFKKRMGDKIFLMIGDVTGHGISRGCYATSLYTMAEVYFNICSRFDVNLNSFTRFVWMNANAYKGSAKNTQISATTLFVEIDKKTVRFINCGHCNPILITSTGPIKSNDKYPEPKASIIDMDIYPPIGDSINPEKHIPTFIEKIVKIRDNDGIFLYTDGITEMFIDDDRSIEATYSGERLLRIIQSNLEEGWTPEEITKRIIDDIDTYSERNKEHVFLHENKLFVSADDVTMYCLKFQAKERK